MPESRGTGKITEAAASQLRLNRLLVLLSAIGCLLAGAAIAVVDSSDNIWCGGFIRAGLLMGAFWIAMPTPRRPAAWANFNPWWIPVIVVGTLVVVRQPRVMVPILIGYVILMGVVAFLPRSKGR